MKRLRFSLLLGLILGVLFSSNGLAQEEGITLRMSRDFGYSSGTGDIQGVFSMRVSGPDDLARVEFFIDEQMIAAVTGGPFRIQFSTDDYPTGMHRLYAIGYLPDGTELTSRQLSANFVSADEGWQAATRILAPVGIVLLAAVLFSVVVPALATRGKIEKLPLGESRHYGLHGGGICPRCQRPFGMHLWGLNLGLSRLDRCPYCGKWSVVRVQSQSRLRQAEQAELEWAQASLPQPDGAEKLRKELEESKFRDE